MPYKIDATVPYTITGPAIMNIFAGLQVYAGKWLDFYYWTFKAEESKVNEMVQWLFTFGLSNPTFDDYNNDRLARYKVTKGQFKKYSRKKANCLMAVGAMCEYLGNTT